MFMSIPLDHYRFTTFSSSLIKKINYKLLVLHSLNFEDFELFHEIYEVDTSSPFIIHVFKKNLIHLC